MGYKLPKNYFMGWLREKINAGLIKIDFQHCHEQKYVAEFITQRDIKSWEHSTPVFISAQTGAGKTYFIENLLTNYLHDKNKKKEKNWKILYLGNRTVLNRQLKTDLANAMIDITGDTTHKKQHETELQPRGIDKKSGYGIIDVKSYQDLGNIDESYKFIICDECHFFTSDAAFNKNAGSILERIVSKGSGAIRIYISATPEVAFEAIIRQEFEAQNPSSRILDLLQKSKKPKKRIKPNELNIRYYDMARNYDYLKIHIEDNRSNLLKHLKNDDGKWLIFISSKGTAAKDYINELKGADKNAPKAILITADNKSDGKASKEFQQIVEKSSFNCNYLVATSVLDNGVSIKSDTVKGIVIDGFFDRVEILQMVGRIRKPKSLELYIIHPPVEMLYKQELTKLLSILSWDLMDYQKKKDVNKIKDELHQIFGNYIKDNYFYLNDSSDRYKYNNCAVYYLINELLFLKRFLEKNPTFSDNIRGQIRKIYEYYFYNEGREKEWSRNIVDLLESENDRKEREKHLQKLIDKGKAKYKNNPLFYTYETGDSFLNYIYSNIIYRYYNKMIWDNVQNIFTLKQFDKLMSRLKAANDKVYIDSQFLEEAKNIASEKRISFNGKHEEEYLSERDRYLELGYDSNFKTIEEEIYRWFELPVPSPEEQASSNKNDDEPDVKEEYFERYVLDKHYVKVKNNTPASEIDPDINMITDPETGKQVRFDAKYIQTHGLWRRETNPDGSDSDYVKFLKLKGIDNLNHGDPVTLNGISYVADQQDAGNKHFKTAYFFIPAP